LAYALALYKHKKFEEALPPLEDVKSSHSQVLLAHQLAAWVHVNRRSYLSGMTGLVQMAGQIKRPRKANDPYSEGVLRLFDWVGRLREYTTLVAGAGDDARVAQQAEKLDAQVASHGESARERYEQGRKHVKQTLGDYTQRIAAADSQSQPRMRLESRQPTSYATFDVDDAIQQVAERLND
jgi:hypothetical protein